MRRNKNSFGVKVIKSFFFFVIGLVVLYYILPPIFSIVGVFIKALPFEVPTNFIVADYVGIFALAVIFIGLVWLTKKWAWR